MATRPYWTGEIHISLVSLPITLQSATRRSSQVPLHELSKASGERIHHQNITEDGKVIDRADIVKGYEVQKDEYVILEDEELAGVRLPSSDTLDLNDFVDIASIPIAHFERPYYVLPQGKKAEEIYDVIAEALRSSGKAGIGQITLRGREELCAVLPVDQGLMIETLRYKNELEEKPTIYQRKTPPKAKGDYITLAKQLIRENSHDFSIAKFHDHYHEALEELIEAKKSHRKPHYATSKEKPSKVVDFAEALRRSLKSKSGTSAKLPPSKAGSAAPRKRRRA
jgi:DNA end-binding protein Ku